MKNLVALTRGDFERFLNQQNQTPFYYAVKRDFACDEKGFEFEDNISGLWIKNKFSSKRIEMQFSQKIYRMYYDFIMYSNNIKEEILDKRGLPMDTLKETVELYRRIQKEEPFCLEWPVTMEIKVPKL